MQMNLFTKWKGFPSNSAGKEFACNAGKLGSITELRRSPGEGNGYRLEYSGPGNSMDYRVHGLTKTWAQLSDFHSEMERDSQT